MYSQHKEIEKKAYNRPNLVIYGDISKLTQENNPPLQQIDNFGKGTKTGFSM